MKYAAFFRALNVGGHGLIKMQQLKALFDSNGFSNVKTYIQSGNIVFTSKEKNVLKMEKKAEELLSNELEYTINTFIRSDKEIENIIAKNPFKDAVLSKDIVLYYAFLPAYPDKEKEKIILSFNNRVEQHSIKDNGIYSLIVKNAGKTLYSGGWLEKNLKMPVTVRNWNTIIKIDEMLKESS
jgi:uncharacterized protein (DUF1697 family)